jgi:hypothetical protein
MRLPTVLSHVWLLAAIALPPASRGQDVEEFRVEVTASLWVRDVTGTIRSGITPVDLRADLGIEQDRPQFYGRLVFQPVRRHRFLVEGAPYRLQGEQDVSRQFTFAGQTYTFQDRVASNASIDFVFGGYQFDLVSRPRGHFGFAGGIAYIDATGTVESRDFDFTGTETQSFPFPLVGAGFRALLVPGRQLLSVEGGFKGMTLGDYGHYVQGVASVGLNVGRHMTVLAGYLVVNADVHRRNGTRGFDPRFSGPVFSVQLRD